MRKFDVKLAQTHQRFQEFYKNNLQQIYANLEPVRQKGIKTFWRRLIIFTIVFGGIITLCATGYVDEKTYTSKGFMRNFMLAVIIGGYAVYLPFIDYRLTTKRKVMNIILSFWGNFSYRQSDLIGDPVIERSEIFRYFNRSEVDDAFSGEYNNVAMTVSEHELRIKGNKSDSIIFNGVLIMLDFPKKFKGKTVALGKSRFLNLLINNQLILILILIPLLIIYVALFSSFFSLVKNIHHNFSYFDLVFFLAPIGVAALIIGVSYLVIKIKHPRKVTQKVALEGLPFMRRWKVLTDDQVEARYILTPILMEKMLEVKRLFKGNNIDFSFFNNKLLIAVHTRKDMFETTSLFTPALSYHKVREVIGQLHAIFSVIDTLLGDTSKAQNKSSATKKPLKKTQRPEE